MNARKERETVRPQVKNAETILDEASMECAAGGALNAGLRDRLEGVSNNEELPQRLRSRAFFFLCKMGHGHPSHGC
jgi:hypothetical protein